MAQSAEHHRLHDASASIHVLFHWMPGSASLIITGKTQFSLTAVGDDFDGCVSVFRDGLLLLLWHFYIQNCSAVFYIQMFVSNVQSSCLHSSELSALNLTRTLTLRL